MSQEDVKPFSIEDSPKENHDSPLSSKNSPFNNIQNIPQHKQRFSSGMKQEKVLVKGQCASQDAIKNKEIKELERKNFSISKAYMKAEDKYNDCLAKMKNYRKETEKLEKELAIAKSATTKLAEEKAELDKKLIQSKEYIRKLEGTITKGSKGEVHSKLLQEMQMIKKANQKYLKQIEELQIGNSEKDKEIANLKAAMNLNLGKYNLNGDINKQMLTELAEDKNKIEELYAEKQKYFDEVEQYKNSVIKVNNNKFL